LNDYHTDHQTQIYPGVVKSWQILQILMVLNDAHTHYKIQICPGASSWLILNFSMTLVDLHVCCQIQMGQGQGVKSLQILVTLEVESWKISNVLMA
jgi:hypothetical protein